MKLGTQVLILGIILTATGASMSAGEMKTEVNCPASTYQECTEETYFDENQLKPIVLVFGGVFVSSGLGGWIGTTDAVSRFPDPNPSGPDED